MTQREVQGGAAAFQQMLADLAIEENRPFAEIDGDYEDDADPRDYVAMASIIEHSLRANFERASPQHREGFVRAMTHMLSVCSGSSILDDGWDPIGATAAAFVAPGAALAVLHSAAQGRGHRAVD